MTEYYYVMSKHSPAKAARGCATNVAAAAAANLAILLGLGVVHGLAKLSGSNDNWALVGFGVENADVLDARRAVEISVLVIVLIM